MTVYCRITSQGIELFGRTLCYFSIHLIVHRFGMARQGTVRSGKSHFERLRGHLVRLYDNQGTYLDLGDFMKLEIQHSSFIPLILLFRD